jgi:hypothetical protein
MKGCMTFLALTMSTIPKIPSPSRYGQSMSTFRGGSHKKPNIYAIQYICYCHVKLNDLEDITCAQNT